MNKKIAIAIGTAAILGFAACSTPGLPPGADYGVKHYFKFDQNWPLWVTNPKKFREENKGVHYFVGLATEEPDYEMAREDAYAQALASLAQSIKDKVHTLFISGRTTTFADHTAEVEKDIQNGVIIESEAVATGMKVDKYADRQYWYKSGPEQTEYGSDVAVLCEMSDKDYRKTLVLTLENVKQHVKNPRARKVIEEMKKLYLHEHNIAK